jgi:glutaredoxin 3
MADVEIYTSPFCGFCFQAKALLTGNGIDFTEINVMMSPGKRQEMIERAGTRSVPQIFVDGEQLGDCDHLHDLEQRGELDAALGLGVG